MARTQPPAKAGDDKKKEGAAAGAPTATSDNVAVYNRGSRTFRTTQGMLRPGSTMSIPAKEAKSLLGYSDLVDAKKMVEAAGVSADPGLAKANADLKAENEDLKGQVETLGKAKTDLEDQVLTLQGRVEELEKKTADK